jgi:hypothetical protein
MSRPSLSYRPAHSGVARRLLTGAAPLLLSIAAMAAEPGTVAAATVASKPAAATPALDLRTPPITETLTQEQIDTVLSKAVEPSRVEEVEVENSRMRDPDMQNYIPEGFASLFWAMGKPSGMWRLFTPMLVQKTHNDISNPTNPAQPAPGIPPMAGEMTKVDH